MIFRLFVYNIEQFPETLLKDVDYETLNYLIVIMQCLCCIVIYKLFYPPL